jgi:uncharacterized protein (DUF1778 family)
MAGKNATDTQKRPVNLKVREEVRVLIDRAAKALGKTRSDFMIDAARRAAEDALVDQTLVKADPDSYKHYLAVLDQPPSGEGFERLMNAPKAWQLMLSARGIADAEAGRTMPLDVAFKRLREELGLMDKSAGK